MSSVIRTKVLTLAGKLYHIERTITRSYDDMGRLESGKWDYTKYKDMTPDQRKHVCDMNTFYQNKYKIYGLLNANWSEDTRVRKVCFTTDEKITITQFNQHISNLVYRCRQNERYASLFKSFVCVRGVQPVSGKIHCHFLLLGVDDNIGNQEYIAYLQREWHFGEFKFNGVDDMFVEANYLIKHLNPDNEQFLDIPKTKRMTHAKDMNKPIVVVRENVTPVYDPKDKIIGFKHHNSNDETILLKPGSIVSYPPIQAHNEYPKEE